MAAAGKAVYPLPLYANAALRDPIGPGAPGSYESGGPTDNVIPIWKVAAPALDLVAPDIYMSDSAPYLKVLELYRRENQFLVTGFYSRVDFRPADAARQRQFLRVEEGAYEKGVFKPVRVWNGDETDWGLNFGADPVVLRVSVATYSIAEQAGRICRNFVPCSATSSSWDGCRYPPSPASRSRLLGTPEPPCHHRNQQEVPAMQNVSIRRASELSAAAKSAVEHLLGRSVAPDEGISVAAVPPQRVPPSESRAVLARNLEVFLNRRADKVNGLPEVEIDAAIDEALHAVRHKRT